MIECASGSQTRLEPANQETMGDKLKERVLGGKSKSLENYTLICAALSIFSLNFITSAELQSLPGSAGFIRDILRLKQCKAVGTEENVQSKQPQLEKTNSLYHL